MPVLTYTMAADLLLKYGPGAVLMAIKLGQDIKAGLGQTEVSGADKTELTRLGSLTGDAIYARLGITPPAAVN